MKKVLIYILALSLIPIFASAHILSGNGFSNGILHPLTGLDHLLAMLAVGIISVRLGGKYLWIGPSIFVSSMILGGILGIYGVNFTFVETGIALSVILSGIAIVLNKLSAKITLPIIALLAIFHGHAHGSEMGGIHNPALYTIGFALSTASLHFAGVALGHFASKKIWSI